MPRSPNKRGPQSRGPHLSSTHRVRAPGGPVLRQNRVRLARWTSLLSYRLETRATGTRALRLSTLPAGRDSRGHGGWPEGREKERDDWRGAGGGEDWPVLDYAARRT